MAKTPSQKSDNAPQKRSREEEEPRETKRQKSGKEAKKAKAAADEKKKDREKPYEKPGHLGVYEHYHLGNLVLRPGDAYVTDTTAAGMRALGRGEDCNYAIVHKVPPTACSQFALIVDWFF